MSSPIIFFPFPYLSSNGWTDTHTHNLFFSASNSQAFPAPLAPCSTLYSPGVASHPRLPQPLTPHPQLFSTPQIQVSRAFDSSPSSSQIHPYASMFKSYPLFPPSSAPNTPHNFRTPPPISLPPLLPSVAPNSPSTSSCALLSPQISPCPWGSPTGPPRSGRGCTSVPAPPRGSGVPSLPLGAPRPLPTPARRGRLTSWSCPGRRRSLPG